MIHLYHCKPNDPIIYLTKCIYLRIVYFMAVSLTAGVFVSEKKQGLLDRSLVAGMLTDWLIFWLIISLTCIAGVTMTEILIGHLFNMFTVIVGQTGLVFVCMLLIFNIPCQGSLPLAVFITCLQGFVGMCFGNVLSIFLNFRSSIK